MKIQPKDCAAISRFMGMKRAVEGQDGKGQTSDENEKVVWPEQFEPSHRSNFNFESRF